MSVIRFLFDEDVSHDIVDYLRGAEPAIDIVVVGKPGGPPKGQLDPDLLLIAERQGRLLVSADRSTMTRHLAAHFQAGHHTHGVALLRSGFPGARYAWELRLIWFVETAEEWIDRTDYLPY